MASVTQRRITSRILWAALAGLGLLLLLSALLPKANIATASVLIPRKREEVWAVLKNPSHASVWVPELASSQPHVVRRHQRPSWQLTLNDGRQFRATPLSLVTTGRWLIEAEQANHDSSITVSLLLTGTEGGTLIDAMARIRRHGTFGRLPSLFASDLDQHLQALLDALNQEVQSLSPTTPQRAAW